MAEHNLLGLPRDVVLNILLHTPLKAVGRLRTVCRQWRDFFSESAVAFDLANMSLLLHTSQRSLYVTKDPSYNPASFVTTHWTSSPLQINPTPVLNFNFTINPTRQFRVWGSCEGLVCITPNHDSVIVFNPTTKQHIEFGSGAQGGEVRWVYGFGRSSDDDFKVLRLPRHACASFPAVATLKKNTRFTPIFPVYRDILTLKPALIGNSLYWVARNPRKGILVILRFDLDNEKINEFALPDCDVNDPDSGHVFHVMNLNGNLGCFKTLLSNSHDLEMWVVMAKIGWVKMGINLSIPPESRCLGCHSYDIQLVEYLPLQDLLIIKVTPLDGFNREIDQRSFMYYELGKGVLWERNESRSWRHWSHETTYFETLVSPIQLLSD